jgi:hypothetical protein
MAEPFRTSQTPNGGWQFVQPQTRWSLPTPIAWTFDQAVKKIIEHRMANRAIAVQHKMPMDVPGVSAELVNYTKQRLGIPDPPAGPKFSPQQGLPPPVVAVVEAIKKTAYGAATIIDWLGSGGQAVDSELSTKRAGICINCPQNGSPDLSQWFTVKASEAIQAALSRRNDLKLSTPHDMQLGVCAACLCPMRLKVHTPLEVIISHLKPEIQAQLDTNCWIRRHDQ